MNLGMNLGQAGGAGIAEHIHFHIIPRREKDTNFITTIGGTRILSTDFFQLYDQLKKAFDISFSEKN